MRRPALLMAALAAAICVLAGVTLPPRRAALAPFADGSIPGIVHIHTTRSDGRGTPDEIAAAAARAGVKFLVFTDHGDATRAPDPPVYRSGVLCLDAVEISTSRGHYVALDMPAAPYPLAGEPRDVVEDVHRLGGFGIAAHPDSPKADLHWGDWDAPVDGVEWINPDTSWRVHVVAGWPSRLRLAGALLHYPVRPVETLASLLTRSDDTMARWNAAAATRRVVGIAGADAHAKLALRSSAEPGDNRLSVPFPSYQTSFEMLSVHVAPDRPLTGDAATDGALVMRAIRAGHFYSAIDGLATPAAFTFTATSPQGSAQEGDEIQPGAVSLHVRSNAPPGFSTIVWRGAERVATSSGDDLTVAADVAPAVYRVEIRTGDRDEARTWLMANAIYVRRPRPAAPVDAPAPAVTRAMPLFDGRSQAGWHLESDPSSLAAVDLGEAAGGGFELRFRYGLAGGFRGSEWAALVWGTPIGHAPVNLADYDRLVFTARADRPMRVSVQLRTREPAQPMRRWQRSVYLDTYDAEHVIRFRDLVPTVGSDPPTPPLDQVTQILFVVDTTNAKPGTSGRVFMKKAELRK